MRYGSDMVMENSLGMMAPLITVNGRMIKFKVQDYTYIPIKINIMASFMTERQMVMEF